MVQPCVLCGSSEDDQVIFGELDAQIGNCTMHRNCLVLCLGKFVQNNADYRPWNFLKKHLSGVKRRISLTTCSYCHELGANLSCCHAGCKCSFHTKCGVDNLAVLQYGGKFDTFCAQHVPEPRCRPDPGEHCVICLAPIVSDGNKDFSPALAFQAPCCQNGWFHRVCVQDQSLATTYFFKCPLCRDESKFADVAIFGVAVPRWRYTLPNPPPVMATRVAGRVARGGGPRIIHTAPVRHRRAPRIRIARSQTEI